MVQQEQEELGVTKYIMESPCMHTTAQSAITTDISAIYECSMEVEQGAPLSPTPFGLHGLVKHLLDPVDIYAHTLMGAAQRGCVGSSASSVFEVVPNDALLERLPRAASAWDLLDMPYLNVRLKFRTTLQVAAARKS